MHLPEKPGEATTSGSPLHYLLSYSPANIFATTHQPKLNRPPWRPRKCRYSEIAPRRKFACIRDYNGEQVANGADSPERMFAKVWEDDGVDYPIAETPAPSTPPTPTFSGLLIDIDDQPLPPAAQLPTSIFTSALVTTSSDNASQATTTFTARGPGKCSSHQECLNLANVTLALNPTRAPFTPSNASTTRPQGAAQNGSPQPPRRGVSNGTPNNTGSPSAFQRQNGPTNTSPQRRPSGLAAPRHRHESEPRLPPGKAHFPKGPGLETTRQALTLQSKKEKEEKEKILLGAPSDSEVFAAEVYTSPRHYGNVLTFHRVSIYGRTKHTPLNC